MLVFLLLLLLGGMTITFPISGFHCILEGVKTLDQWFENLSAGLQSPRYLCLVAFKSRVSQQF